MKVIKTNKLTTKITNQNKPLIAIWGFFDGWHLGHQALLAKMMKYAQQYHYQTLVISFDVKPQSVLLQKSLPILLNNQDKINYLINKNVDYYCQLTFTQQLAQNSAQAFINWLLKNHVQSVVVNRDVRFGAHGQGNLQTLQATKLKVFLSEDITDQNQQKISSTYIKELLENKQITLANHLLANKYTITGKVVAGIKEGRTLGFPTANLQLTDNYVIPGSAVYLSRSLVTNKWYQSMTVVIMRNNQPLVESYLLDFHQDIYGKIMKIQFLDYLRDNIYFSNKVDLIAQINQDLKNAIIYFKNNPIN